MTLTPRLLILLLAGFSLASNLGALAFQHIGGLEPCAMCYWQRYPHWAAFAFGALALMFGTRLLPLLGALSALATSLIGFYHSGVERKWWPGPASCTGSGLSPEDSANLLSPVGATMPMCDEIPWEMFGITMANLNAIGSLIAAALWVWVIFLPKTGRKLF